MREWAASVVRIEIKERKDREETENEREGGKGKRIS